MSPVGNACHKTMTGKWQCQHVLHWCSAKDDAVWLILWIGKRHKLQLQQLGEKILIDLIQIKAAACGRAHIQYLLCHVYVGGCMFECDMLWLQGGTYIYLFPLWHPWGVLTARTLHSYAMDPLVGKSNAIKHWTVAFQEFKMQPSVITGSGSFWLDKGELCLLFTLQRIYTNTYLLLKLTQIFHSV